MMRQLYRVRVTDCAVALLRTLHPHIKRKIRAAFRTILQDPLAGKALTDELAGLRSFRVSHFRIIYRLVKERQIEVVAIGPRDRIYEETYRLVSKLEKE